jgi:hypothetical protein
MFRYPIIVHCYSGHTYAERPRSFQWRNVIHEIKDIESSWLEPGERHFMVQAEMNKVFHLCYNERHEEWSLITEVSEGGNDAQGNPEDTGK